VFSVCSSGGIIWIGSMPGALFHERCRCASIMPGISVAPSPSISTPAPRGGAAPRWTALMRLPWTVTAPGKGGSPSPVRMLTLVKVTVFSLMAASPPAFWFAGD
jgi:hypothetical protein